MEPRGRIWALVTVTTAGSWNIVEDSSGCGKAIAGHWKENGSGVVPNCNQHCMAPLLTFKHVFILTAGEDQER